MLAPGSRRAVALAVLCLMASGCAGAGGLAQDAPSSSPGVPTMRVEPDIFEPEAGPPVPPPDALVAGVPFVSWDEAARLWYRESDHANPSSHAAFLMVLGYWGQHWSLTENREAVHRWGLTDARRARSMDELKPLVAAGIPVIVDTALTAVAHPLAAASAAAAPWRGVLGPLVALSDHPGLASADAPASRDSLFVAFRVVVGYDDTARRVVLHDPAFGPAVSVGYDDFERAWAFTDRAYIVMRPWEAEPIVETHRTAPPYRARTASEEGAEAFVLAAALDAVGRPAEARAKVESALERTGLHAGVEHLLRLERASHRRDAGDLDGARADAERAAWLVPEHYRPWVLLAEVYRALGLSEAAEAAARRARNLAECGEAIPPGGLGGARPLPAAAYARAQRLLADQVAGYFFVATACEGSAVTWLLRPLAQPR